MSARRFFVGLCAVIGVLMVVSASAFASAPETPGPVTVVSIKANRVLLHGVLNPNTEGEAGTYEFLYKASASECQGAGTARGLSFGLVGEEVSQEVKGLSPNTEYSVCLLARTLGGETSVGPVETFKTALPPETPVTVDATSVTAHTAVLHGTLNPANSGEAGSYRFRYAKPTSICAKQETEAEEEAKKEAGQQTEEEVNEEIGATTPYGPAVGLKQEAVSGEVTGLLPNTTYTFCVLARNSVQEKALGAPVTFTTPQSAPTFVGEPTSKIGVTEATLSARVDPGGASTDYRVEYGPSLPYASSTPEQSVYSTEPVTVQVSIANLQPGVLYHYRLIASNSLGTIDSTDYTFSTYPEVQSTGLPDDRGYEKVSPNNNADGNVYQAWPDGALSTAGGWTERPFEAAADGDAVAYVGMPSEEGGTGAEGGGVGNQYLARRLADGDWQAENVTPPSEEFATKPVYQGFTSDLSHGFLTTNAGIPLVPGAPADHYHVPYVRDFETGAYEALMSAVPPHRGSSEFGAFQTAKLGDRSAGEREPAFAGSSADLSHVLFMANDALTANAVDGGEEDNNLYDFHDGVLTLVNVLPDGSPEPSAVYGGPVREPDEPRVNAPDFSHVISEDGDRIFWTGQGSNLNIYMREDGSRTVQIDAAVGGGGQYWTATPDGSKVLFTKGGDLYEYNVENGQTTDLAPGGEVQGIVGTSEDLSYVYLVANAVLAPGGKQGACPYGGECGLYVLHDGEPARFIAMLSKKDNFKEGLGRAYEGDWQEGLADKEAEVTPDGRQVLFGSTQSLTGYDNNDREGYKDEELFLYEFESSKLRCVSCNPSGEPPASSLSAYLPVSHQNTYSPQWMSDDGSRVFFNGDDPLVPQDTNGLNDVYEWERDGAGSCTNSEGCIYLLTGGTGGEGAYLIGASSSGDDVFFTTRAQLIPEDQNENIDVYDAHVGAIVPPAQPQCTGTGCQGLPSAPPVFATPSSVTYNGVGNFSPAPTVSVHAKKAKAKKAQAKKKKKHGRSKKSKKAKGSAVRRRDKGHGSSTRVSAVSYGRGE